MRILFCNKYNFRFSGTEAYLFDLMGLLQSAGHDVALFSMDSALPIDHPFPQYLAPTIDFKARGQSSWTRARKAAHIVYSRSVRARLRWAIRDFRPDIAHVRNIYHHLSPSILWEFRAQGIPVLYQVNDFKMICPTYNLVANGQVCDRCHSGQFWRVWTEQCYAGSTAISLALVAEAYLQKWWRTYPKCISRIVAPSGFVRDKLVESGWPNGNIDVLYHFQRVADNVALPPDHAPILYFGRLSSEKGVDDLLRAMQVVPGFPLLIAGDGPARESLEQLARQLSLANVTFLGQLSAHELNAVIASARFTVFPSHAGEVLGKAMLESYAHARPVVASDLGSRRELVQHGRTGLLYSAADVGELAKQISWLYSRPRLADEMGQAGFDLLRERHCPDAHLSGMTAIYDRLLQSTHLRTSIGAVKPGLKLRIAFIGGRGVGSKYSGIESYYEQVGKRLADMGHQMTIYCRSYFTPKIDWHPGVRLVRLPTIRTKHFETLVHTLLSTLHAITSDCDIVHYQTLGPALFSFLPKLFGKKTVVTVQGLDWQRKKWGRIASWVLKQGERAAITFPNCTMVVSRTLQQYFGERYRRESVFIPNGTQIRMRTAGSFLDAYKLKAGKYVLFLGRFSPEKNCDLLIRAFERIDADVQLVLAGGSSHSQAYVEQLQRCASDKVRLLNWVSGDDLEELLTNAMLFVLPSDLEGLSLALLDAMGAGICVLASDIPENREVVEGAGFTFRAGNEDSLVAMLQLLITNPNLREEAVRAAQERIRQSYLWPDITFAIEREYRRVLGLPEQSRRNPADAAGESYASQAA